MVTNYHKKNYWCPLKIKNEFSIAVTLCKSECAISTDKSKPPEIQTPDAFEKTFSVQENRWILLCHIYITFFDDPKESDAKKGVALTKCFLKMGKPLR